MAEIGIIVPIFRVEKYLEHCINSILNQTYKDYLLTIIDDGSDDLSPEMADEFALLNDAITIIHSTNGGPAKARNIGLDYFDVLNGVNRLAFVDSDDWLDVRYFELLLKACIDNGVDISICEGINEFSNESTNVVVEQKDEPLIDVVLMEDLYSLNIEFPTMAPHNPWGKLIKYSLFKGIRFPVGKFCEDRFTMYQALFRTTSFAYVRMPLYRYFINNDGLTREIWTPKKMGEVESCEEQIDYFDRLKFDKAYNFMIADYLDVIFVNMWEIKQVDKDYCGEYELLKKKLRKALKIYRKKLCLGNFSKYDYYAYPLKMKLFDKFKAIMKK